VKWRGISTDSATLENSARPLAERLLELRAGIAQYVRPENQAINERTVEWLRSSGALRGALQPGSAAPAFTLPDANGEQISSTELLASGPLVIVFFRGRWCPFCVAQLEAWRDAFALARAIGARLVAISPQTVHQNSLTADQHKLPFPVLSDSSNVVAKQFGIAYRAPEEQELLYRRSFVNLPHINGDESWQLPLAATFIISQSRKIVSNYISADYRERTDPQEALATIRSL
jgi:peroxiredoxin